MARLRRIGWLGFTLGLVALGVGVLLAGGSAIVAGDWWLAPMPWIDLGMRSLVIGMALASVFAILLVVIEPVGWLRLISVPPALFLIVMWWVLTAIGFPFQEDPPGVATSLYSMPNLLVLAVVATLLVALPLLIARLRVSRAYPAR
jgi:hypothetical protein